MSSTSANRDEWRAFGSDLGVGAVSALGRIPSYRTSFIGRETAVSRIRSLILDDATPLVTLVGTGGSGKTRLAIEAAKSVSDEYQLSVRFVSLASIRQSQLVMDAVAMSLAVDRAEGTDAIVATAEFLGNRSVLLVLDNMEHLLEAAIDVDRLLANCPGVTILTTSRKPLNISGERLYRVGPLTLPASDPKTGLGEILESEAGRLFVDRARIENTERDFTDGDAATIAEICAKLDGLPLAIELAASRTNLLSLSSLLAQFDLRLPLLTHGSRDTPVRHQTLREAIAWSYNLLSLRQQRLFRRLSIFVGGFTLEAAEAISRCDDRDFDLVSGFGLDHISDLVDSSLINLTSDQGVEPRFTMLEMIRQFGQEQQHLTGELDEVSRLHAAYYQQLAQRTRPLIEGRDGKPALDTFEIEHPNIRKALTRLLDRGDISQSVRLTRDLWKFWWVRQHGSEARSWMARTLALAGDDQSEGVVEILYGAGVTALSQGDVDEATRCIDRALSIARANHYLDWVATHHFLLANIESHHGDLDRSCAALEEGITLSRLNDPPGSIGEHRTAMLLTALALNMNEMGDMERALELAEEAHSVFERRGDLWGLGRVMSASAELSASAGDFARAIADKQECIRLFQQTGDPRATAVAVGDLAGLAAQTAQPSTAIRLFGAVESIPQQLEFDELSVAQPGHLHLKKVARAAIGERFADLAWNEGRGLTLEQAVQEALELSLPKSGPAGKFQRPDERALTRRELDVLRLVVTGATD